MLIPICVERLIHAVLVRHRWFIIRLTACSRCQQIVVRTRLVLLAQFGVYEHALRHPAVFIEFKLLSSISQRALLLLSIGCHLALKFKEAFRARLDEVRAHGMLQKTNVALFSRSTATRTFGVTLFADSSRHEMRTRVAAARLSIHELGRATVFGSSAWWATTTTFLFLLFYLSLGLGEQIFLSALAFVWACGSWNWDRLAYFSHKGFCLLHSM